MSDETKIVTLNEKTDYMYGEHGRNVRIDALFLAIVWQTQDTSTISGNMNSEKYIKTQVVQNLWQVTAERFQNSPFIFQDDNA